MQRSVACSWVRAFEGTTKQSDLGRPETFTSEQMIIVRSAPEIERKGEISSLVLWLCEPFVRCWTP
jgi:hypothetical protein